MLKRLDLGENIAVSFTFEGRPMAAVCGDTIAAALLAAGQSAFRSTPVSGTERGPFCMIGACFDCLVEVDGVKNLQACMLSVKEGMSVRWQRQPSEEDFHDML